MLFFNKFLNLNLVLVLTFFGGYFHTVPIKSDVLLQSPAPIHFAVIGDFGAAGQAELDVANLVKSWNPEFIITVGDNNYETGSASTIDKNIGQYYHDYIYPYTGSYGTGATINKFFPALGNHDWGTSNAQPYLDYFTLPGNERYYDFVKGPVHFFVVDSDTYEPDGISSTSTQANWLKSQLAASTSAWKIVYLHHAPYSSGLHGSSTKLRWPFADWGADAVLAGHDHTYERILRDGIVYFVNGLGGKSKHPFSTLISGSQVRYSSDYGAILVDASETEVTFQFITRTGVVIDSYTIPDLSNPPAAFNKSAPTNGATDQSTSPTLSWATSTGAASYEYCYDTSNDNACSTWTSNGTATSKALSGLSAGTTYYWHVRAINGGATTYANGSTTSFWSFTTIGAGSINSMGTTIITSTEALAGTGRLHLDGQITAYNSDNAGDLNVSVPMLFKNQFGGDYDSAVYIQNTHASNTANFIINFFDVYGAFTCSVNGSVAPLASVSYWLPNVSCLPAVWSGGVNITSSQPISAVGRSHIGSEVTSYNDFASGSTTMYVPMLFKNQFGGDYDSALYVQNMSAADPAHITIKFYDVFGVYSGEMSDTLTPLSSTGYWLPLRDFLPDPWSGSAVITSDQPIVAIGRPHIGSQVTAYNGFASGSTTVNVPMLFKNKPGTGGVYSSAVYVQNVDPLNPATVTTSFYDDDGTFRGSLAGVVLPSLSSTGFWLPLREFLPDGWSGSAILTSDRPIVALGRLHVDGEISTYNGSPGGTSFYLPLLFQDDFNGLNYDSMLVLQNTQNSSATVTVNLYKNDGASACSYNQSIAPHASANFWLENLACP